MPRLCETCSGGKAVLKRPKTQRLVCKPCFLQQFEEEVHTTITTNDLFQRGERLAIGASGGKDSTVLAHVLGLLNRKYNYGLDCFLLSIDEGIRGYRDDSLKTVALNQLQYGMPLKVVSFKELYGWTMDEIVARIGKKNNCTYCGVFRRQALDRGAEMLGASVVVTGHNADDLAETVFMNILRGDIRRLACCVNITTSNAGRLRRCKPFKYSFEKEIVMYAHFKRLLYFSTECTYAPFAYRGHAREFLKRVEHATPRAVLDIVRSAEYFRTTDTHQSPVKTCETCGYMTSQRVCQACAQVELLNKGRAVVAVELEEPVDEEEKTPVEAKKEGLEW